MYITYLLVISSAWVVAGQPSKCDQTPPDAVVDQPQEENKYFRLRILSRGDNNADVERSVAAYTPEQTYILRLSTNDPLHSFTSFMITAEDPEVDKNLYQLKKKSGDAAIGSLKTLDTSISRYSERCANSVENADNTDKKKVEVHWVSPPEIPGSDNQGVRIRAMVEENSEVWYEGDELTVMLTKNNNKSKDSPPVEARETCQLCSEARYEVIFYGRWSRVAHPYKYPTKPDENGYSHMVGASHASGRSPVWEKGSMATRGLMDLAESAYSKTLEREIIDAMSEENGTRTLIRGKKRHHPYMSEPSHALFRVDRVHHLFSIAVGMRPSPDWFLGTSNFELCTEDGWLEEHTMPLYPWDAGSQNGVSYESHTSLTRPQHIIDRVDVGSFNRDSPFYQMNLNDMKPYAELVVRRLDVYECAEDDEVEEELSEQEAVEEDELE